MTVKSTQLYNLMIPSGSVTDLVVLSLIVVVPVPYVPGSWVYRSVMVVAVAAVHS